MLTLKQKQEGWHCRCIRCREIRNLSHDQKDVKIKILTYPVKTGRECFISYENKHYLFALLRLFLPDLPSPIFKILPELKNCGLIRELQVFGEQVPIGQKNRQATQHRQLGKKLIYKAEQIALSQKFPQIAIIAAAGVRGYYRKLGYRLSKTYMIKNLC